MKDLSIVIPVLNEEEHIGLLLEQLMNHPRRSHFEIIVADGGSTDATVDICRKYGLEPIETQKAGRGYQMNAGAEIASTDHLFFLHVDSRLPKAFYREIKNILSEYEAGCFRLGFDSESLFLRFYSMFTAIKSRWLRFGDQGLFIRKRVFKSIGGFNEKLYLMEDQEIYMRILKKGDYQISKFAMITSARKYRKTGIIKTQVIFAIIMGLYYLGAGQQMLKHFHQSVFSD